MHDAYEVAPVLENLPLTIDSITSYDDVLLVGTHVGHVLVYKVESQGSKFDVKLEHANKAFAKRPITQLEAVPDFDILISLTDNVISIHELHTLKFTTVLSKTKGAITFAAYSQEVKNVDGSKQMILRLCVAVRKKLMLYYWKTTDQAFHELREDMIMPDLPKTLCWCRNSICVGFKRDYYLININDGEPKQLFQTGKNYEPLITRIDDSHLALRKDNLSILIDDKGTPTQKYSITWADNPEAMVYSRPYLVGILPKFVEIRSIDPRSLIQTIELDRPRFVSLNKSGVMYVASTTHVWRLVFLPVDMQIKQLVSNHEFELALQLSCAFSQDSQVQDKIKNHHAFELFCQKRFVESMKIFQDLNTDPSHVVGMYPDMLPSDFRKTVAYPGPIVSLAGAELEKALVALIDYLTEKRQKLQRTESEKEDPVRLNTPIIEGGMTIKTRKHLRQIIDTTLLKCYIEINDALVAPLLRLPDNSCHIEESEKVLKKYEKWGELIYLYETKGLHKKALIMLQQQSNCTTAPAALRGPDRTVEYLQHLGKDHLSIIKEYSAWVLKTSPEKGLEIFIDDLGEVEGLPRVEVLKHLSKQPNASQLIIPYLEHIIHEWNDTTSEFHEQLIDSYRDKCRAPLMEYINSLPEGQLPVEAGKEDGDLGRTRNKMLKLLQTSQHYRAEVLIKKFPYECFHEERAILQGKCGLHKQALFLYVYILQRLDKANEHCHQYYNAENPTGKDVYLDLLSFYLTPVNEKAHILYGVNITENQPIKRMKEAMELLHKHSSRMDCRRVLDLLPDSCSLVELLPFLQNVIEQQERHKRQNKIIKNLLLIEKLAIEKERIGAESTRFSVTESNMCLICHGKISNSSFARTQEGQLLHYYCMGKQPYSS